MRESSHEQRFALVEQRRQRTVWPLPRRLSHTGRRTRELMEDLPPGPSADEVFGRRCADFERVPLEALACEEAWHTIHEGFRGNTEEQHGKAQDQLGCCSWRRALDQPRAPAESRSTWSSLHRSVSKAALANRAYYQCGMPSRAWLPGPPSRHA